MKVLVYQFHVEFSDQSKSFFWGQPFNRTPLGEFWKLSSITCKRYAEKYGFDYIFDNPDEKDYTPYLFNESDFERFKVFEYLKDYDAVVVIDTDVLVTPDAEDIVKKYDTGYSNIVVNTSYGDKAKYRDDASLRRQGFCNQGVTIFYRNSGYCDLYSFVHNEISGVKCDKDYWWKYLYLLEPHLTNTPHSDNTYNGESFLSYMINLFGIHVDHLDRRFNYLMSHDESDSLVSNRSSRFLHFVYDTKFHMKKYFDLIEKIT